ncbi:MAG: GNAT family N-acetyltransferase [Pseudomonadota bacterium]
MLPRPRENGFAMTDAASLRISPANGASWDDLELIFAARGDHRGCWCQRFKTPSREWYTDSFSAGFRPEGLRAQTQCGNPNARATSGLVAYLAEEPVGWCAVEPRSAYVRLGQTPWKGRTEDKADDRIWAATCFIVRKEFRGQRISYALARAAVEHARSRGADILEGYPIITTPGKEITWGELHVGSRNTFEAAGFSEVCRPSKRRVVMQCTFRSARIGSA